MALNTNALTTVANLKSYLGLSVSTFDTLLEIFINGASKWISKRCGDRVFKEPASDAVELYDGDFDGTGRNKIFTKAWPINSITSIEYKTGSLSNPTWVAFTADDYTVDEQAGIIYFTGGFGANLSSISPNRQNIRLTYKGGFATGDENLSNLELACLKMSAKEFDKRKSQGATQESVGGGTVTWNEDLDPSISDIINPYRRF